MMTSIHMNPGESQASTPTSTSLNGSLNQIQTSPVKYDETERALKRREELLRHHAETVEIHQRTQPMIDDQIHEDTLKYLKTGPVNGTKTKSQKPRAPKRQRNGASAASNVSANQNSVTPSINSSNNGLNQFQAQTPSRPIGSNNNLQQHYTAQQQLQHPHQYHQHPQHPKHPQHPQQPQQSHHQHHQQQLQPQQIQQQQHHHHDATMQPQHMQQTPSHQQMSMPVGMQPMQHTPAFSPNMQQSIHIPPQQPNQMQQAQSYNENYQNRYQPQAVYQQQQPQMQLVSHGNSHMQTVDQGHHHYMNMHSNNFAQQNHQSFHPSQQMIGNNSDHHYTTLPTDLDLTIQAGLECDVESLIKHELSVEGQLDFNSDLLVKLDGYHYQPNYQ